ncbi:MAG: hypothetical protein HY661_01610 [Betaproteobacteria bacterium]|nr:hypothetical protein [Betaproteobacteria bacterium]
MKRKFGIIAASILSTMVFSQVVNASEVVNPEDSGYLGPVILDNAYQAKAAAAPSTSSPSRFHVVVNPEDSGYLGPVILDNAYQAKAAAAPGASSPSRIRVVVNPDDSGYLGPEVVVGG